MSRRIVAVAAILLLSPFAAISCSGDDSSDLPAGQTKSDELPSDWPSDFPLYHDADLDSVGTTEEGAQGEAAIYKTDDGVADVTAFYKDAFDGGDWMTVADPDITEDGSLFLVEQADGDHSYSSVTISAEGSGSSIAIVITQE